MYVTTQASIIFIKITSYVVVVLLIVNILRQEVKTICIIKFIEVHYLACM